MKNYNHLGKVLTSDSCLDVREGTKSASDNKISGTNPSLKIINKMTIFDSAGKLWYQVSYSFFGTVQPERMFATASERYRFIQGLSGGSKIYKGDKQ
jgi:hypothetical protein